MTTPVGKQRFKFLTALRRRQGFARNNRGAVAVEFALLALPFFTIVAAILETAIVFLASQVLESSVHDTARLIKTGQAQSVPLTVSQFKTKLCERGFGLFTCDQLKVRVRIVNDFTSASVASPLDPDDASWILTEQYEPGLGKQIIIAEAYYKWPTVVNLIGFNLADSADGTRLLGAVRVWRNEPF